MPIHNADAVTNLGGRFKKNVEPKIRAVIIHTFNDIIKRTPVDTGRARSGWIYSVNKPKTTGRRKPDSMAQKVLDKTHYLTNDVDYVNELESGSSKQAPRGMVRIALRNGEKRLRQL